MVSLERSGNVLAVNGPAQALALLASRFRYNHKKIFMGPELRERQKMKAANPHLRMHPKFETETRLLYQTIDGTFYCGAGLLKRAQKLLDAAGFPNTFTDLRATQLEPPQYDRLANSSLLEKGFRYRQDEVLALIDSEPGGLLSAPTGYGKTHLMAMLQLVYPNTRMLFISSGLDLIRSTYFRLSEVSGHQVGRIGDGYMELNKRILLCSADSLHHAPLDKVGLIIADEVHELATDLRVSKLVSRSTDAKWFGLSASLHRRFDGADAVLEALFGSIIMDISYSEGVDAGVVAPIEYWMVDMPPCITIPPIEGESWQKCQAAYWRNDWRNARLADAIRQAPAILGDPEPQSLIMVSKVEHLFELLKYLPDFTPVYANMNASTRAKLLRRGLIDQSEYMDRQKRASILRQFEVGKLKRVIATHCWKKGIDPVHLKVLGRFDGETSGINSIQLPGRLSRIQENKDRGLLIDSNDRFDPWAEQRAKTREKDYVKAGFKPYNPDATDGKKELETTGGPGGVQGDLGSQTVIEPQCDGSS